MSKLSFLIKKRKEKFPAEFNFQFPDPDSLEMLDPDPDSTLPASTRGDP